MDAFSSGSSSRGSGSSSGGTTVKVYILFIIQFKRAKFNQKNGKRCNYAKDTCETVHKLSKLGKKVIHMSLNGSKKRGEERRLFFPYKV